MRNDEDAAIIAGILQGDVDGFAGLLEKYENAVFAMVARRVPAGSVEAVTHDVFVRAFRSLESYHPESPFGNWLSGIAARTCCDFWREQMRHRRRQVEAPSGEEQVQWFEQLAACRSSDEADRLMRRREAAEVAAWLLERLDPEDRILIECVYIDGTRLKEVAAMLGWSLIKTKVRAMRLRRKMRRMLESIGE